MTVDNAKGPRRTDYRRRQKRTARKGVYRTDEDSGPAQTGNQGRTKKERLRQARYQSKRRDHGPAIIREPSVAIGADWDSIAQYELASLETLQAAVPSVKDLGWFGELRKYRGAYDRLAVSGRKDLRKVSDVFYSVTAREDPVFHDLIDAGVGTAFASDAVLSHLMTCRRSVYPWDVVVSVVAGKMFLDCRKPAEFDMASVNETATRPPPEEEPDALNGRRQLAVEATSINRQFSQQILAESVAPKSAGIPACADNPLHAATGSGRRPASVLYRYRMWDLGEDLKLVGRTTLNGVQQKGSKNLLFSAFAFNEFNAKASPVDWRKSLDSQRGAVLATELKNNSFKVAKWAASSMLASADALKIGFVSRKNSKKSDSHVVLGVHAVEKPEDFLRQLSLDPSNMWGVIKWVLTMVRGQAAKDAEAEGVAMEEFMGKYVIMRDPNKEQLLVLRVPPSDLEDDEEGEESAATAAPSTSSKWSGGGGGE
jgi:translation initiation factor 3 subunit D